VNEAVFGGIHDGGILSDFPQPHLGFVLVLVQAIKKGSEDPF
jgi:hypothetical protein